MTEPRRRRIRTYYDVPDATASDIAGQLAAQRERLQGRLAGVQRTLAIMSGKGGVGKSLITANLAAALAADGLAVGVLDADLNGPSMARLLGAARKPLRVGERGVQPARGVLGVKLMSMDLLLAAEEAPVKWAGPVADSFVWRGTQEANTLREFLADTEWGQLDYMLLDLAPGTDRVLSVHDVVPRLSGLLLVTIPSELSRFIVKKSITMARELEVPTLGYVENMVGYLCPHCGKAGPLFEAEGAGIGGVLRLAAIPFDPGFGRQTEAGRPGVLERPKSAAGRAVVELAMAVRRFFQDETA